MNWPGPSTCSWRPCGCIQGRGIPWLPGQLVQLSPGPPMPQGSCTPHTPRHPTCCRFGTSPARHNLHYPKCSLYCSLHTMQPWHGGEHWPWSEFIFCLHTRRSICFIGIIFSSAYCISWSTPEAQGSVGLFKTLCGRGHAPMSQSHLVGFEMPADGKHVK